MSRLRIVPIVEGHGEVAAMRILLQRLWTELLGGEFIDVLMPIRKKRDRLVKVDDDELCRAVQLAANKLTLATGEPMPGMILVMIDAENDLACQLGPALLERARRCRSDKDVTCVIANHCYETWFVAAASSLSKYLDLTNDAALPESPELTGQRKGWIAERILGPKYSETVDMPRLTAEMDLAQCRLRSPSFDKLCRELEARLTRTQTCSD